MFHWIRDCKIDQTVSSLGDGAYLQTLFTLYHFLRTAGWTRVWEIDGYSNHIVDGGMEEDNVTNWTALSGATISKDTTQKHMGYRSLKVDSTSASDGVESIDMTDIQAGGNTYSVHVWVYNASGRSWYLESESGTGAGWTARATLVSNSTWTEYTFDMTSHATLTVDHRIRVIDTDYSAGASIYIDSAFSYRPMFENRTGVYKPGSADGQITAPDQFQSGSYTFVAGDVSKYVCIWDTTNLGNSGVYQITGVAAGVATLDLRATDSPTLASQSALAWRMIDVSQAPYQYNNMTTDEEKYPGFGLESPHAENWRLFCRANYYYSITARTWVNLWASPYDADFDVNEGDFYNYEAHSQNYLANQKFDKANSTYDGMYSIFGREFNGRDTVAQRLYLLTDDDGTFLNIFFRDFSGGEINQCGGGSVGFTGADSYHTLRDSFALFFPHKHASTVQDIDFVDDLGCFANDGSQCSPIGNGWTTKSTIMVLGLKDGLEDELDATTGGYKPNPVDGNYWLRKPKVARDYFGVLSNTPAEKTMDNMGLFHGPPIDRWQTIDTEEYLHVYQGWYLKWWNGHKVLS